MFAMFVHRLLLHSDIVINYHKAGLCRSVVYGVVRCSAAPKPIYTFAIGNILMVSRGVYWCVFDQYIYIYFQSTSFAATSTLFML